MKKLLLSFLLMVVFAVPAFSQTMNMPRKEMDYIYRMGNMTDMYLRNADKIGLPMNRSVKLCLSIMKCIKNKRDSKPT